MLYKSTRQPETSPTTTSGSTYKSEEKQLKKLVSERVWELLKHYNCLIAGGAITSLFTNSEINDLDVYFPDELSLLKAFRDVMSGGEDEYALVLGNVSARTLMFTDKVTKQEVQFMTFKYFKTPQEIFDTFDFTCCMGSYSPKTGKFFLHEDFLKHNAQRYLKFNKGTAYPIMSLLRVDKYRGKGYDISKPEMLRVIFQCMNLEIDTWEEAIDHMAGMYGFDMSEVFDQEEEFTLDKMIDQLSDITERDIKELTQNYTVKGFEDIVKEFVDFSDYIDDIAYVNLNPDKYFYKCVDSDWKSPQTWRNKITYEEGEVVNGGSGGIYVHTNVHFPHYCSDYWVELELLEGVYKTDETGFMGSEGVLKGDVLVKRRFIYKGPHQDTWELLNKKYPGQFES